MRSHRSVLLFGAVLLLAAGQVTSAHADLRPQTAPQVPSVEQTPRTQFIEVRLLDKDNKVIARLSLGADKETGGDRTGTVMISAYNVTVTSAASEGNQRTIQRLKGDVTIKARVNGVMTTLLKVNDPNVTVEYLGTAQETPKSQPAPTAPPRDTWMP